MPRPLFLDRSAARRARLRYAFDVVMCLASAVFLGWLAAQGF